MITTNVPIPTISDTGIAAPATADFFAGVMADFAAAFNSPSMSTDPETPQGQLGTSFAEVLQAFVDFNLAIVSRVDPATSSGRMQDGIGRFFNLERIAASPTTVLVTCGGAANVVIPVGALAKTQGGDIYSCVSGGTIPAAGSIDLEFQNTVEGDVPCPAGYLNEIYQSIPGWDTVLNASDGTPGTNLETAQAFELRRQAELTKNARGFNAAVRAQLLDVPGVVDAYVTDNSESGPLTIRGVTLPAGSLYACVYGGADLPVATAIWQKKGQGTPMYAVTPTTVVVEDTGSGYAIPYPTYTIVFDRPVVLPVVVSVQLSSLAALPDDYVTQVQNVVLAVFAGDDSTGLGAPTLGSRLLASRFQAPIAALGPWALVVAIGLGSPNNPDAAQFTGAIDNGSGGEGNVLTVTAVASGTLATGQYVEGAAPGTIITGQSSGAPGGVGVYSVGVVQLLASSPLAGYAANQNYVDLNLNQRAGGSAADVLVEAV
jgi:hypothetical protein